MKDEEELINYFYEWLKIWNEKFLKEHFIPNGKESNFWYARMVNDLLEEDLLSKINI